jgi:hypothetical protein
VRRLKHVSKVVTMETGKRKHSSTGKLSDLNVYMIHENIWFYSPTSRAPC